MNEPDHPAHNPTDPDDPTFRVVPYPHLCPTCHVLAEPVSCWVPLDPIHDEAQSLALYRCVNRHLHCTTVAIEVV